MATSVGRIAFALDDPGELWVSVSIDDSNFGHRRDSKPAETNLPRYVLLAVGPE